jgi:Flp pilus assembly protein TadD
MAGLGKNLALGCGVTVGFFVLLELILMAAGVQPLYDRTDPYVGFSGYAPLFVERTPPSGEPVLETADNKVRWFNPQRFAARKEGGVTRIFCLGGSTTYGRPYDDSTSFCGWLRLFLPAVDPSRRWEVINAGGISYASYRVARLMEELADYEPDLFIVYSGHNEFLEQRTYGSLRKTPEFVRDMGALASRMRLYSALYDVSYGQREVLSTEVDAVLDHSVGPEDYHRDDEMRVAVVEHYRESLTRMTRIAERAGAGMIFVTPASNVGDFSPFKTEPTQGLSADVIRQADSLKLAATRALDESNPAGALEFSERALALDDRDADLLYLRGRALRSLGRVDEARDAFYAARDEDIAPLRALSPFPEIVADVARESNTGFVDFASIVDERSPNGIPGSELFLDHVHPTIEGNRLLALAIVQEMVRKEIVFPAETWSSAAIAEISEQLESSLDERAHALALGNLSQVLIWAGKHEEAERLVDIALAASSEHGGTHFQKATLARRTGDYETALIHYREAARLTPMSPAVHHAFGVLLSELGRKAEARVELEAAVRLDPTVAAAYYDLGIVLGELGEGRQAEVAYRTVLELEPGHANAYNNLGVILAKRGDLAAAEDMFARALAIDPDHTDATENLARARAVQGR